MNIEGNADFKRLVRKLRSLSWEVSKTANGHWKFMPPDPNFRMVVCPGTPTSIWNTFRLLRKDLKKSGFVDDKA